IVASLNGVAGLAFGSSFGVAEVLPAVAIAVVVATLASVTTAGRGTKARWTVFACLVALAVALLLAGMWANTSAGYETSETVPMIREGLVDGWWRLLTTTIPAPIQADLVIPVALVVFVAQALSSTLVLRTDSQIAPLAPPVLVAVGGWAFGV